VLVKETKPFGVPYDKLLRGPIPDSFIKGGHTRKVPFVMTLPAGTTVSMIEAVLTYSLIPIPDETLMENYLATLGGEKEREQAKQIIQEYTRPRVLTYRVKSL